LVIVVELSQSSWLAAGVVPGIERRPLKKLDPDGPPCLSSRHDAEDLRLRLHQPDPVEPASGARARNVEMMWLTGRLTPDFKTIADFRKDNGRQSAPPAGSSSHCVGV
jgi:hypothetical protein